MGVPIEILRLISSGSTSKAVLRASGRPSRSTARPAYSIASARLVLPSWLWPSKATLRIFSGSTLAIDSPFRESVKRNKVPPPLGEGRVGALVDRCERDDLDGCSGGHLARPLRHDDEAVGIGHRSEHVRALVAGQPDSAAIAIAPVAAAEHLFQGRRGG